MKSRNSDPPSKRAAKTAKSAPPRKTRPRKKAPAAPIAAPAKTAPALRTKARVAPAKSRRRPAAIPLPASRNAAPAKAPPQGRAQPVASPLPVSDVKRRGLKIPPILLEGDGPAPARASGPGSRYVLGPTPPAAKLPLPAGELPESYGTRQLFLAARDPRWLYAHWDFTAEQLRQ